MKIVTVKVPDVLDVKLRRMARQKRTTRSAVVREAIEAFGGRVAGSFGEVAGEFIGVVKGPRDLSSNKAHLKAYGR